MLASFEIEDDAVEFEELGHGEYFVDGETTESPVYLLTSFTHYPEHGMVTKFGTNLIDYSEVKFEDDHIVCRVKFLLVNPQA